MSKQSYINEDALTQEYLLSILEYDPDTGEWIWLIKPCSNIDKYSSAGTKNRKGHKQIYIDGIPYRSNRLAWLYMTGEWPKETIDHKDRNKSNDKWSNLREADMREQTINQKISNKNTSGIKGVSWDNYKERWIAFILIDGKLHRSTFKSKDDAIKWRKNASLIHYGKFDFANNDKFGSLEKDLFT